MSGSTNQSSTPLRSLGLLPVILFGMMWASFGIVAFIQISAWGRAYDHKMSRIATGTVPKTTLFVASIRPNGDDQPGWIVWLSSDRTQRARIVAARQVASADDLSVGQELSAYQFRDEYLIPTLDRGGHSWGRWLFLAFGLVPPMTVAGVAGGVWLWRRRKPADAGPRF
jgi:hypothetical protein